MTVYRQHQQPGCGGCLLMIVLFSLLFGGTSFLFKLIGTVFFLITFLFLAFIAVFLGFSYYLKRKVSLYEQSQTEEHNVFVTLLINILVKIAEIDGAFTREEEATIQNFFRASLNYSQAQMLWVKEIVKEARQTSYSMDELLAEFKQRFAYEPRLILLELIYQVIFSNSTVPESELELARRIADYLQIAPYDLQAIQSKYLYRARTTAAEEEKYYDILGLQPGAGFEEIRNAYRKLSQKYHPDKVNHLGEEFRKVAEEKMKELNIAYQFLKKRFS